MELLHIDGIVVGTREDNFTHWFIRPTPDAQALKVDDELAEKIRDPKNPTHAEDFRVTNGKLTKQEKQDVTTIDISPKVAG